uniref:Uncharacterized protein n=1 Tax=Parascaris univalens TaxID=6257 RepID=A0A915A261_PARUN
PHPPDFPMHFKVTLSSAIFLAIIAYFNAETLSGSVMFDGSQQPFAASKTRDVMDSARKINRCGKRRAAFHFIAALYELLFGTA